jgi:Cd2+/Zn2+-exporting ATPase
LESRGNATTLLTVPSMCCAAEFGMVEKELRRIAGVREVSPDFIRRSVRVQHQAVPDDELLSAAARSGFEVRLGDASMPPTRGRGLSSIAIRTANPAHAVSHAHGPAASHAEDLASAEAPQVAAQALPATESHWKLIAGGVLALAAEGVALALGDHSVGAIVLAVAAIGLAGLDTYRKGLLALRRFNLNINALMTVAVTGAAVLGQWPEAAMVMVLFAIAEMIEDKSLDRARRAVEGLMAMAPETATVQDGAAWREVPASTVKVGALVRVRPGERIALDGQVTSGASAVDQAAITGESVPVDKAVGDPLFAGTINQNSELAYRVTAV